MPSGKRPPHNKVTVCKKCGSEKLTQEYPAAVNWIGWKCLDCGYRWMYDQSKVKK